MVDIKISLMQSRQERILFRFMPVLSSVSWNKKFFDSIYIEFCLMLQCTIITTGSVLIFQICHIG